MADEIEDLDSENQEDEVLDPEADEVDEPAEGTDKPEYTEAEKAAYARAKKAEAEAKELKRQLAEVKPPAKPAEAPDIDRLLDEKLEKRELEALDLSDELKKKVQTYAKTEGVSIKKALTSDFIQFLKEKEETAARADDASLGGGRKGTAKKDYSQMTSSDFDVRTPEGQADFEKWEEHMRKTLG